MPNWINLQRPIRNDFFQVSQFNKQPVCQNQGPAIRNLFSLLKEVLGYCIYLIRLGLDLGFNFGTVRPFYDTSTVILPSEQAASMDEWEMMFFITLSLTFV